MTANQIFKVTLLGKHSLVTSTPKQLRDLDMDIIRAQREAGRDLQSCHGITYELVSTDTVRSFKESALKRLAVEHADKPNDKRDTNGTSASEAGDYPGTLIERASPSRAIDRPAQSN